MSLYSPIEQIPPELLLFKTIGTILVLFDEKDFVLALLFIVVVAAISAPSFSSERNNHSFLSNKFVSQEYQTLRRSFIKTTHTHVPTYRTYICAYLLVFMLPSFKTNLSEKILLSVKQLHEERRTAEVEKCK